MKDPNETQDLPKVGKVKGFPSHFVAQSIKKEPAWNRQYIQAFLDESNTQLTEQYLLRNNKDYPRFRKLARGEQSQLPYKELLGLKKAKNGEMNTSFRNINFDILMAMPKIKNVMVNKIMNTPFKLSVRPIDPQSMNERRDMKAKMMAYVTQQESIQRFQRLAKMGLEGPMPDNGEMPPISVAEIDPWLDMTPRDATAMEVMDYFRWCEYYNDWEEVKKSMLGDLFDLGLGGARPALDSNGVVRLKAIVPDRCRSNACTKADFSDIIRFGEFREVSISELRKMTQGKISSTKKFESNDPEEMYRDIANSATKGDKNKYGGSCADWYQSELNSYTYDVEKVTIFEAIYSSTDLEVTKQYKNGSGNNRHSRESFDYVPYKGDKEVNAGKGMTDEEFNKKFEGQQKIYRKEVKNVYKSTIVHGTDYLFDFGMMENMPRQVSNPNDTALPIAIYALDCGSIAAMLESPADQVQMNWLQFQSHVSASRPPGIAIEKKALARVALGGKGGKAWDPKEDLMMFAEIGSIAYDGYDQHGNPLQVMPIMELKNGLSPGAMDHYNIVLMMIEMMRNLVGLNALTEGQAPPERLGKGVAQLSFGASDNALSHVFHAYKSIYKRTMDFSYSLLQSAVSIPGVSDYITEGLGLESYRYFKLNKQISLRDMAIVVEEGPDEQVRADIKEIVTRALDAGEISGDDALMITMEDNIFRAIMQIRKKRREREEQKQRDQMQIVKQQGQENTATGTAVEQAKVDTAQKTIQAQITLEDHASRNRSREQLEKFMQDKALKMLELGQEVDSDEKKFLIEMMKVNQKNKEMNTKKAA